MGCIAVFQLILENVIFIYLAMKTHFVSWPQLILYKTSVGLLEDKHPVYRALLGR